MKLKKIISAILAFTIMIASLSTITAYSKTNDETTISFENPVVHDGDTVKIPVSIVNNTGFVGIKFIINYDENVLDPVSIEFEDMFNYDTRIHDIGAKKSVPGKVEIVAYNDESVWLENGIMFYVEFSVVSNISCETKITMENDEYSTYDKDYEFQKLSDTHISVSIIQNRPMSLYSDLIKGNYGDIITVPVKIKNNRGLYQFEFCFEFDEKLLKPIDCSKVNWTGWFDGNIAYETTNQYVCMGENSSSTTDIFDDGELFNITFQVLTDEEIETIIKISGREGQVINIENKNRIPAFGHDYSNEFTVDIEPTCTTDGEKSKHCSRCDNRTDITVIDALGHSFGEWKTVVSPDCTNSGSRQRVCTACGFTETENLNPNGHKWNSDYTIDIPATCTTNGSKSIHCANCDAVKDSQVIPATGHNLGEYKVIEPATCIESGLEKRTCANCDYSETREIPALGHDYAEEFTIDRAPTCTENGEKSRHCSRCDLKADITVIPATGHSYGEWTVVTAPTCTEKGAQQRVCSVCGNAEVKEISATGHIWNDDYTVDKEPTCTTEGSKSIHCANCDGVKDSVIIPAVGHSGGKANCHSGAICDSCGKEYGEPDLSNHDGETEIRGYIVPTVDDFGYTGDIYCKSCGTKLADGERIDKLPPETTEPTKPSDTTENPTDKAESTTQKSETTNISDSVNKNTSKKSPATGSTTALPIAVSTAFAISLICVVKRKKKED